MKIAILIPSLNTGGAERTAVALANWLANNKNNEVHLINLGKNDNNYTIDKKVNLYNKHSGKGILQKIMCYFDVIKYLNTTKPDVLFEMLFTPLKYALIYKMFHWKSVIIGSERANPIGYRTKRLKFLCHICPIFCDGYIFQTVKVQKMFPSFVTKKSIVIPNAISNPDVYLFEHSNNPDKRIISVGRLNYHKAFDVLIKSFAKVIEVHPEYELVIYGEGELRNELENLVKLLKLDKNILLPGTTNRVIEKIANCEIFVMSSRYEGMPNALLESMAIGMPCVSTDCTDLIENEKDGLLVEVDNIVQMSDALIKLIDNKGLQKAIASGAKNVLEKHSVDNIYSQYYDYFKKVYEK